MDDLYLQFLGVGGSGGMDQGSAAAVFGDAEGPQLLIDCGQDTPHRYRDSFGALPPAVFITHVHMDHVSGLEPLFYAAWFDAARRRPMPLFVPAPIVPALHQRLVSERSPLAEGGVNLWDAYQLVPVGRGFWWRNRWFDCFPVRHHRVDFAFGLRLAGAFWFSGDTRPVPELVGEYASSGETLFHDCRPDGNPSHSGWNDLVREYPSEVLARLYAYHYGTRQDGIRMRTLGARVAETGRRYRLGGTSPRRIDRPDVPPDGSTRAA